MLAAFPPPGLATPTRDTTPRPQSSWPVVETTGLDQDPHRPKKKRRCCGLPCWGFFLVLLILLIIIAAAVVVPLELLVFHKHKSTSASTVTALQACSENPATACQNGGTSSLTTGSCSCICINGFTGSTCSVLGTQGCTTTTLSSDYTNVTVGDSIPRLIAASQTNFSIPLFGSVILARFNSASLTCVSENALVTFDGQSARVGSSDEVINPSSTSSSAAVSSTTSSNKLRRDASSSYSAAAAAATANGILYDPSSQYTTSDSTPAATTSAAASQASVYHDATFSVTEEVLDFSRVAVLFVLQQESLDSAESAQTNLQKFLSTGSSTNQAAHNVSLGNGNTANLLAFSVDLGNGSVGAANASMTKRSLTGRKSINLWTGHV
jgi:hypothetical protein